MTNIAKAVVLSCALIKTNHAQLRVSDGRTESCSEQPFTAEDDKIVNAVAVPPSVLAIIANDPDVKQVLAFERPAGRKLAEEWLLASQLQLNGRKEQDLIVIGRGPLRGSNVTTFWLFQSRNSRFRVLLNAVGHTLIVSCGRTQGYRDIEVLEATAASSSRVVFKFNGSYYRRVAGHRIAPSTNRR